VPDMSSRSSQMSVELTFPLQVEDDWPPVAKECLVMTNTGHGYRLEVPPLFVRDLAVGDVVEVDLDGGGEVAAWRHVVRSRRSTVWLMVLGDAPISQVIRCLQRLSCNIEELNSLRYFSIDVPEDCALSDLDRCLEQLDSDEVAVAYPAFRH
jgi:hypothetical protein